LAGHNPRFGPRLNFMVDAIVFDIGNVLLRFDFGRAIRRIAPFCSASVFEIPALLEPLKIDLESGRLAGDLFLKTMAVSIGFSGDLSLLRSAWQEIFDPIEMTHELVSSWKGRYPLYLLSNTNDLHAEYFLARYPVFSQFDGAVFSHEAGMMKPAAGIYDYAVEKFALNPARTLFIDDLLPNVEAAQSLGWLAHHYREDEHSALLSRARALNLL